MQAPLIHLNGTSRQSLLDQLCDAGEAVRKAMDALCQASPNGRDYYPLGPEAYKRALDEHQSRYDRLTSVRRELEELTEAIADAGH